MEYTRRFDSYQDNSSKVCFNQGGFVWGKHFF